jgi:hypothetical protein
MVHELEHAYRYFARAVRSLPLESTPARALVAVTIVHFMS